MSFNPYPTKLTIFFISTLLLLASVPTVSASEEVLEEFTPPEELDTSSEEEDNSKMMEFSIIEGDIEGDELDESQFDRDEAESDSQEMTGDLGDDETIEPEGPVESTEPDEPEVPMDPAEPESNLSDPIPETDPETPEIPETPETPEQTEQSDIPEETPMDNELVTTPTIEPVLEPNPIEANASTITGTANPEAHVIVMYPETDKQRATTVNSDGSWLIRNVGGDQSYLTDGARIPMQLILEDNGQELTYSYEFEVGDATATDLIEESQMVYVSTNTEPSTVEDNSSSTDSIESTEGRTPLPEEPDLLPATGEENKSSLLAFVSIVSGVGLLFIDKLKRKSI